MDPERERRLERRAAEGRAPRHCRHCLLGGCPGDCLFPDGQCIHGWNGNRPRHLTWRVLTNGRWWRRVLGGQGG